jgi:hypothetical protein
MKRDMDLIRKILAMIEDSEDAHGFQPGTITVEGYSPPLVNFHVLLLCDAGLVDGNPDIHPPRVRRLTWEGCEFLDAYRDDTFWNNAKSLVIEKIGSLSYEALKAVTPILIKQALGG